MKATLTFHLPEEQVEFDMAQQGARYRAALDDVSDQLRTWRKHGHEFSTPGDMLEAVWEHLHRVMEEHECQLY